ncbi:MAG: hypothetical protein HY717_14405 [Planctomycetes bacterium]|nr:hypothetical protein [Planctomycetota bacterium]
MSHLTLQALLWVTQAGVAEVNLSGEWAVVIAYNDQTRDYSLDLKQDGEKISGSFISPRSGKYPIQKGSFKDGKLNMEVVRNISGQDVTIKFDGKLVGEKLEGMAQLSEYSGSFSATRKSQAKPAASEKSHSPVGTWKVTAETQEGREYQSELTIEGKGGQLSGSSQSRLGSIDYKSIQQEGGKLRLAIVLPINGQDIEFHIEAAFEGDRRLHGTWRTADGSATGPWRAERQAEPAASPAAAAVSGPGIAGLYRLEASTPEGVQKWQLELEEKDGQIAGQMVNSRGEKIKIQNARVQDGVFTFSLEVTVDGSLTGVKCSARLGGSARLEGRWETASDSGSWSARRLMRF